jgi:hypothetical protein
MLFLLVLGMLRADLRAQQTTPLLSGYARDIQGEVLSYWSFHPFARQSLLTRTTTGTMTIAWETQPVPASPFAASVSFMWIGAYSTGTSRSDHTFDLVIDGRDTVSFVTQKGGVKQNWTVTSRRGASLSFKHVWTDHVLDAHGYCTLTVPAALVRAGRPLHLSVTGRASPYRDWYMTFRYAVRESAQVRSLPFLVRDQGRIRQPVEVSIDAPFPKGTATVTLAGQPAVTRDVSLGWNSIELLTDAVASDTSMPVVISVNGGPAHRQTALVRPVARRTIYLLPHSHNDIGYSDVQTKVADIQRQNLRDAIRLAEATRAYPDGARFRWNVEILWPIDSLLQNGSPDEIDAFVGAARRGEIGLNALSVNPLTGISRPEALMHLTDVAQDLRRRYGLETRTAMISDIPGYSWGIVPALTQAGVRYFTSGPNSGDRIGHFGVVWGDKPFWWRSPSGKDSLLVWVAGTGYSMFHATRTLSGNDGFRLKLTDYLERLTASDYPYDLVQMRYSIYSDNGMTDSTMPDVVRDWNARTVSPVLRIATSDEMFKALERRYGASLPSYSGDLTPYWEDGAASTAAEVGSVIRASESLAQSEILAAMLGSDLSPSQFDEAWSAVNLWNEHTWGAWNSVSDPDHPEAVRQWEIKRSFAVEAERRAEGIRSRVDGQRSVGDVLEIINTSTWERTDIVTLSEEDSRAGDVVTDERGGKVRSQRLTTGELMFRADRVPPLGSKRYRVIAGAVKDRDRGIEPRGNMMHAGFSVSIDTITGSVSGLRHTASGPELVRPGGHGMNSVVYVDGTDPARTMLIRVDRHGCVERGPLVLSYVTEGEIADRGSVRREVRLIDGLDRVEFINTIDKRPVRTKEALYFAFDLNVSSPTVRMDLGWGVVRPEADQLPGSCKDYFSVQRWVDATGPAGGILWATSEAPLIAFDGPVDERRHNEGPSGWKTSASSSGSVFSYVMNNYWHTNYKADQSGRSVYRYAVRPHEGLDPVAAYRFGVGWNQPFVVRRASESTPRASFPVAFISSAVTAATIRPARDGEGWIARLYNPSPDSSQIVFRSRPGTTAAIQRSSLHEERGRPLGPKLILAGFEVMTVRIEVKW